MGHLIKTRNAILGFALGVCSLAFALVAWPVCLAAWCWSESDDDP